MRRKKKGKLETSAAVGIHGSRVHAGNIVGRDFNVSIYSSSIGRRKKAPRLPHNKRAVNNYTITLCDRRLQDEELKSKLSKYSETNPGAPQIYFLTGHIDEQHQSYVQRVRDFTLHELSEHTDHERTAPTIFCQPGQDFSRGARLSSLLERLFDSFPQGISLTADPLIATGALIKNHPALRERKVIIRHRIDATEICAETISLLEDYFKFWGAANDGMATPQILIFCNVIYPPALISSTMERFCRLIGLSPLWSALTIERELDNLVERCARLYCPAARLSRLTCVPQHEIHQWLDVYHPGPTPNKIKRINKRLFTPVKGGRLIRMMTGKSSARFSECARMLDVEAALTGLIWQDEGEEDE
jgi:hypothetical protein